MKVCIIQPEYSTDYSRSDELFEKQLELLEQCDSSIDKAHVNGIICNVFWSDDVEEAKQFLEMGIDTILTNDYNLISQVIK